MKKILSIIATSLLWVSSAEAGVPLIQEQGNSRYTIQLDSISMTIDANGGKILSFRYGDDEPDIANPAISNYKTILR